MNLTLEETERELQGLAHEMLSRGATAERVAEIEETPDRFDRDLWSDLAEAGLLGAGVAEDDGGLGLGVVGSALVATEVGRTVAPLPYVAAACAALVLSRHATPAQKQQRLAGILAASTTLVVAPPLSSSDLVVESGRVSGTLVAVPWAHVADALLVVAGDQVVLVDLHADGISTTREETTARQVALDLTLDRVSAEEIGGRDAAQFLVESWLTLLAAQQAGVAEGALRLTASYTSEREQFGKPLSTFQAVALQAADAYVEARAIDAVAMQAAWSLDADVDATLAVLTAAWWASDAGQRCVHRTQHLHGGMGADITYPVHRYFLHGKQIELMCGAASSLLAGLGDALADRPLAGDAVHL